MDAGKLFRKEAIHTKQTSLLGGIVLVRPVSFTFLVFFSIFAASIVIIFAIFGTYTKRSTIVGQLVPLDKIGLIANALEIDALQLFKMCMEEYQPSTWDVIAPFMEPTLTRDETRLLMALRESTGGLSLSALGDKSRQHLEDFILSVSVPLPVVQTEARSDS